LSDKDSDKDSNKDIDRNSEKDSDKNNKNINKYCKDRPNNRDKMNKNEDKLKLKDFLIMMIRLELIEATIEHLIPAFGMEWEELEDSGDLYSNTFINLSFYYNIKYYFIMHFVSNI
jgi:hypothetical protein